MVATLDAHEAAVNTQECMLADQLSAWRLDVETKETEFAAVDAKHRTQAVRNHHHGRLGSDSGGLTSK